MNYLFTNGMGLIWIIKVLLNKKIVYLIKVQIYIKLITSFEISTLYIEIIIKE